MNTIDIQDIVIKPNRQRQEFEPEALQELKTSIEDRGLLHPPVLRQEDGAWVLVAGERRLKAIAEIFELGGQFSYDGVTYSDGRGPFSDLGDLSLLEAEEAELDENLRRLNLTWQEHASAVGRLHALRSAQRTELINGIEDIHEEDMGSIEIPASHTIADTAEELTGRRDGSYQDKTRKEIIISQHLDNPVIAKAKNADEAYKLLKKDEERQDNIALAAVVGASFNADMHELYNTDCITFMADPAQTERFDVILTDPPYGMNADNFGDAGGKMTGIEHHYDDSPEHWTDLMSTWAFASFRVAKPQAHAYVFCDFDKFHELKKYMQAAGWYVFRTPFISCKLNSGRVPLPDQGPRRQYEIVLYAIKGKKPVTHIYGDVIQSSADENMSHGAQKPVALYQNLLQRSVKPGDTVLDSFCGTGTIFPACHNYKCKAVGIEQSAEYFALSMKRLKDVKTSDDLGIELDLT